MTPANYANDHSRLLDKFAHQADALAALSAKWSLQLAAATAEAATAEERFTADPTEDNARELVEARSRVANLTIAATAIEDSGGPSEARRRALATPAVYSAFAKGFAERILILEKLIPNGLKRLGERRAVLTESGIHFALIEADPVVSTWRGYGDTLARHIAAATFGVRYSSARGANYAPKSFDALYSELTQPLPDAPAIPATSNA